MRRARDYSEYNVLVGESATIAVEYIRSAVGDSSEVLCLVSGGVDSAVCAALLHRAIGAARVHCVHVDHGFMRHEESAGVVTALRAVGVELHVVNAAAEFLASTTTMVKGATDADAARTPPLRLAIDPEHKRRIVGDTFMTVANQAMAELKLNPETLLLAQGTLRPDLIESGSHLASGKADAIKTHHNDTDLVRALRAKGKIIEPLADYHKDEVRQLGLRLGLPESVVMRQPFPGPGLVIRVLCTDGPAPGPYAPIREAVKGLLEDGGAGPQGVIQQVCPAAERTALRALGLKSTVLPIRSVGVQGDGRTYAKAVCLYLPSAATAGLDDAARPMWPVLMTAAKAIPKIAPGDVNRVVFAFGGRPAEAAWAATHAGQPDGVDALLRVTPTTLTDDVVGKLREADHAVAQCLARHQLLRVLAQVPVVLLPLAFAGRGTHAVVVRTFITNDFMTGVPAVPGQAGPAGEAMPLKCLAEIEAELMALPWCSAALYDLTAKPPGTTEWE